MRKFLLFLSCFVALPGAAAPLWRGPYLENPTPTAMTLRWQTAAQVPSWLEYGPVPRCNQIMTVTPAAYNHKAVLYGLVPNQDYCYHVYVGTSDGEGVYPPVSGTFHTLFSPERKVVTFLALGDTGANPDAEADAPARQAIADLAAQETADFVVHTGNMTSSGLNADADSEWFKPFAPLLQNKPTVVALGPREYGPELDNRDSKSFLHTNYTRYHDMPWSNATPKYYYFDTANVRVIVLDANAVYGAVWAPDIDAESAQTKWLKTTLSQAADKWKVVVVNAPIYSTGVHGGKQELAEWAQIFEDYRVNLVLQGGDTDYERTFPLRKGETHMRGVTYLTLGTAARTPTKRMYQDAYTARFVSARHYAVVKVVDRKLTVIVRSDTGRELDKFEMYL